VPTRPAAERSGIIDSLVVIAPERMVSHNSAAPGTFTVRIEKADYQPWSVTLAAPAGGVCGPPGIHTEARLKPVVQP
jgi:hypothetical protein